MTDADVQTVLADLTQNRVAHVALSGFIDEGGDCDEVRCRTSANGIITLKMQAVQRTRRDGDNWLMCLLPLTKLS